jgi:hypothetical protein
MVLQIGWFVMTHTLHRQGNREALKKDYVILAMAARGFNVDGSEPKFRKIIELFSKHNPVNMGNMTTERPLCMSRGASPAEIIKEASAKSIVHAVYTNKEVVTMVVRELKEADLGISIVVTGIFDEIFDSCKKASVTGPFTINMSLGVMGKTEMMPSPEILEITTMCGHALVSRHLAAKLIEDIKKGRVTPQKAANELARQCVCGIFNTARAADLLGKYAPIT